MDIYKPNQTSADLLVAFAKEQYFLNEETKNAEKFLLIYDVYIKARTYSINNKIFFILSLIFGIMVLLWPSIAIFSEGFGFDLEFLGDAIVQTTVTGIAALTFAIYSHYKKRQMYAENLMRFAIYSEDSLLDIKNVISKEMERIDTGFGFGKNITLEEKKH